MYFFAIDFAIEMLYPLAPPQGWKSFKIFEKIAKSKMAFSPLPLAFSQTNKTEPNPTPISAIYVKPTPIWDDMG
jgi:hypothetical protein